MRVCLDDTEQLRLGSQVELVVKCEPHWLGVTVLWSFFFLVQSEKKSV